MSPVIGASLFGIKLVGLNGENLQKLLLTLALLVLLLLLSSLTRGLLRLIWREHPNERARFWGRQGISLAVALVFIIGVVSIWFNDPTRLATALGLVSAGLKGSAELPEQSGRGTHDEHDNEAADERAESACRRPHHDLTPIMLLIVSPSRMGAQFGSSSFSDEPIECTRQLCCGRFPECSVAREA